MELDPLIIPSTMDNHGPKPHMIHITYEKVLSDPGSLDLKTKANTNVYVIISKIGFINDQKTPILDPIYFF